jgi:hypothetical protein
VIPWWILALGAAGGVALSMLAAAGEACTALQSFRKQDPGVEKSYHRAKEILRTLK